jgi:transketolase
MDRKGGRPFMLVGRTVKGRGVSFMENVPIWHYRSPKKDEYAKAIAELTEVTS